MLSGGEAGSSEGGTHLPRSLRGKQVLSPVLGLRGGGWSKALTGMKVLFR